MALQISEIGIRLAVGDAPHAADFAPAAASGHQAPASLSPEQIDDVVQRCARVVLASIERLGDR
ncbi:hypothetical protein [Sphingomonas pokkalii]|uniref:hypothetical protein n=1 Tax=Sphingomonas pokkalii TaxID=2175090 RepID=UPI0010578891|nr:hypothetical protein [Sphingomonas pokkalii]